MKNIHVEASLPRMGGGAIISLLDKNGNETYNSGFVQNDLTDAGIWEIIDMYGGNSNRHNSSRQRNNLMFTRIHNTLSGELSIRVGGVVIHGERDNIEAGRLNNNEIVYSKTKSTFEYGVLSGELTNIYLRCGTSPETKNATNLVLDTPLLIDDNMQVVITYYRFVDISELFRYNEEGGTWSVVNTKVGDIADGTEIHFAPLEINSTDKYIFLRPRVVTTQYNNSGSDAYRIWNNSLALYLDGDKVGQYTFAELAPKSTLGPFGVSESELRSGRIYDAYIQPNKGTLTFDAVTIGFSPVYKSDITVIFPEPITKTDKDVFNLKLSYTVTGGRDSLDLSNIMPLLD